MHVIELVIHVKHEHRMLDRVTTQICWSEEYEKRLFCNDIAVTYVVVLM